MIDLLKTQQFNLADIKDFAMDDSAFMAIEPEQISPMPVFLQTGYLTIASYEDGLYTLDFPNYEVKYAFNRTIIEAYGHTGPGVNIQLLGVEFDQNPRNIGEFIQQQLVR